MNKVWEKIFKSVVKITHLKGGHVISSGTGFIYNKHLITNNHVFYSNQTDEIKLHTVKENGFEIEYQLIMPYSAFRDRLKEGMGEESWDFAIIDLESTNFEKLPSLEIIEANKKIEIGEEIALFGFPLLQENLSMNAGHISSKKIQASVKYIQVDASVNRGNSGGPLIEVNSGKVIGIVTRKGTGLTEMFDQLKNHTQQNLNMANQMQDGVFMMGISFKQVLVATQTQSLQLINEIERSANVGIGYAFELVEMRKYFE
jgi:V8-like Glu-specific endopeptidase